MQKLIWHYLHICSNHMQISDWKDGPCSKLHYWGGGREIPYLASIASSRILKCLDQLTTEIHTYSPILQDKWWTERRPRTWEVTFEKCNPLWIPHSPVTQCYSVRDRILAWYWLMILPTAFMFTFRFFKSSCHKQANDENFWKVVYCLSSSSRKLDKLVERAFGIMENLQKERRGNSQFYWCWISKHIVAFWL